MICSRSASTDAERQTQIRPAQGRAGGDTGLIVPMVTTNLFSAAGVQGRRVHLQRSRRAALRAAQGAAPDRPRRRARREDVCDVGRPRGRRVRPGKDIRAALERYREAVNLLAEYVTDKGYDIRFAIEPKPNEPRGDILLPTVGHALAFIDDAGAPGAVRRQPRGRSRADDRPELRRRDRSRRCSTASCSTST